MSQPTLLANRYNLSDLLGSGAMGDVYRATDTQTGDTVAVKHLKPDLIARDPQLLERFKREGEALRDLKHPNIVRMIDALEQDGNHYLIMEYVGGGDLNSYLTDFPLGLPIDQTLSIAIQLADALTRSHFLNIVHRDIKPHNVLLAEDGTPRLTDFGIAHFENESVITQSGAIVGTYAYLSPEACMGIEADTRSDIWAFGIVLFEMLAGQRPFTGASPGAIISAIIGSPVPDLQAIRPEVSDDLADLVYRMLVKDLNGRIPSIRLVGAGIESLMKGGTPVTGSQAAAVKAAPPVETAPSPAFDTPTPLTSEGRHNLPRQTTAFVGRSAELEELSRLIQSESTLISIIGPGGMGKSRLSLEVAHRQIPLFEHGVFFVELAPLEDPQDIPLAIAEALDFPFREEADQTTQLLDFLSSRHLLLILDNFEHILGGVPLVDDIMQSAPGVTLLATSRQRLNLSGEQVFTIGGMDFPAWETPEDAANYSAVQLFLQSARRVRVDFNLEEENLDYVARICKSVQGLPLGILLAAAWVDSLSLEEIADEIQTNVDFLESELQDLPERQRSMRAVFEYSWNLLNDDERAAYARMSIFRGGATRQAIQTITGAGLRMLTTLVSKSLLHRDITSGRYEIHELLRQYGEEFLREVGEADSMREAHSQYYLGWLSSLEADIKGRRQVAALGELEADAENIRAAWQHAVEARDAEHIAAACQSLFMYSIFKSRFAEGRTLFAAAKRAWPLGEGSTLSAWLHLHYPDTAEQGAQDFEQAYTIAQTADDPALLPYAQNELGKLLSHQLLDPDRGITLLKQCIETYRQTGADYELARALDDLSFGLAMTGQFDQRAGIPQESLAIRRRIGDRVGVSNALRATAAYEPDMEVALRYAEESMEIARELNYRSSMAWNAYMMANLLLSLNRDGYQDYIDEAIRIAEDTNDIPALQTGRLLGASVIAFKEERYEEAMAVVEEVRAMDYIDQLAQFNLNQILIVSGAGLGRPELIRESVQHLMRMVTLDMLQSDEGVAQQFMGFAMFALLALGYDKGDYEITAIRLALFFRESRAAGAPAHLYEWPYLARLEKELRQKLGDETYEAITRDMTIPPVDEVYAELQSYLE